MGIGEIMTNDSLGDTPLHFAVSINNIEIVKVLLHHNRFFLRIIVNVKNKNGKTPLDVAREKNHLDIVALLEPVTFTQEELFTACRDGNLQRVMEFIVRGFNINVQDKDGKTALNIARENNQLAIVEALEAASKQKEGGTQRKNYSKVKSVYKKSKRIFISSSKKNQKKTKKVLKKTLKKNYTRKLR
jgi:ankyrin repeat protein